MNQDIPTQADFQLPPHRFEDLDGWCAWDHFGGRTLEDAYAIFKENPLYYQEDLMWMAPKAFCFYLPIAMRYLKSEESAGDSDIINCLASAIEFHFTCDEDITAVYPCILEICDYVSEHYSKFDIEEKIYGDLRPGYDRLRQWVNGEKPAVPELEFTEVDENLIDEVIQTATAITKSLDPSKEEEESMELLWGELLKHLREMEK